MCCSGRLVIKKMSGSWCGFQELARTSSMFRWTLGSRVGAFVEAINNNETASGWIVEKARFYQAEEALQLGIWIGRREDKWAAFSTSMGLRMAYRTLRRFKVIWCYMMSANITTSCRSCRDDCHSMCVHCTRLQFCGDFWVIGCPSVIFLIFKQKFSKPTWRRRECLAVLHLFLSRGLLSWVLFHFSQLGKQQRGSDIMWWFLRQSLFIASPPSFLTTYWQIYSHSTNAFLFCSSLSQHA